MEEDETLDIEAHETTPLIWTRNLTTRLLDEYKLYAPKVGVSIKSLAKLHTIIASNLRKHCKIEITSSQVANKLKSLKRKYVLRKTKGLPPADIAPGIDEAMKLMDRLSYKFGTPKEKVERSSLDHQNEAAIHSIKTTNGEVYSVEFIEEGVQHEDDMMDHDYLIKKANTSKILMETTYPDPLEEDVVAYDPKQSGVDKLDFLDKKLEKQERSLEERRKKNELIGERNRLIATLLAKKTKNDVIDAFRKDRLLHHQEMKDLWAQRLDIEKRKLLEKKRKNDLLEERNKLMKTLIKEINKKSGRVICNEGEDVSACELDRKIELG